jgi:hypothetical protein
MSANPKNVQAVLDWVGTNRPDCLVSVKKMVDNDGFWLLMAFGFEAGREFQKENPEAPMGPEAY